MTDAVQQLLHSFDALGDHWLTSSRWHPNSQP